MKDQTKSFRNKNNILENKYKSVVCEKVKANYKEYPNKFGELEEALLLKAPMVKNIIQGLTCFRNLHLLSVLM